MRNIIIFFLFFCNTVSAQQYKQLDTIANPETALPELYKAIAKDPANAELYLYTAQRKLQISQYDSCIFYCNTTITLLTKQPNDKLLSKAYFIKGAAQYFLDDKEKSKANLKIALQLSEAEQQFETVVKASSLLGAIFLDQGYLIGNKANFHQADSFLSVAYETLIVTDSLVTNQGLKTLRLMATSFHFQKKYDSAEVYYKKILELSRNRYTVPFLGATSFYAKMLSETGRHDEAIAFIKESAEVTAVKETDTKTKTHIMHVYGEVLFESGNYKKAYKLIDSAYYSLAETYEKANAKAYAESESKFKNQLLQYQVQLEQQKKNRLYYLIGGLILLTGFAVVWLQNKNNKRIALEKARQKQISIDAFIEGEEKEKVRIGRELHDGIAQEVVGIKLAMQQQKADPKLIEELTRISLDIRNISHELMPQTLKDFGLKFAFEDICQKILGPSGIQYELNTQLPEERLPHKIEITLYRVFQELVHNIIKHSHATEVLIQLRKMNNHILLVVEDNGKGFTDENKRGIGINNLKSRVQLLDGNLQYESGENEGTTAIVRVPV